MTSRTQEERARDMRIITWTGRMVNPSQLRPRDVCIEDIAHALSLMCRFNGHVPVHYSVAEHCVRAVHVAGLPADMKLEALLHDAAEAYIGDVVSPLKVVIPDYLAVERIVEQAIAEKWELVHPWPDAVRRADRRMLVTELRDVKRAPAKFIAAFGVQPMDEIIIPWEAAKAESMFLAEFTQAMKERR